MSSVSSGARSAGTLVSEARGMNFIMRMMRSHWKTLNRGVKRFDVLNDDSVVLWRKDCM